MSAGTTNPLDQAQNVKGVVAAARMRDRFARKEANATDDGERRLYREAIFDLEQRFTDLADVPVGGAEVFARERGHGRGSGGRSRRHEDPVHDGRQRRRSGGGSTGGGPGGSKTRNVEGKAVPEMPARPYPNPVPGVDPTASRDPRRRSNPTPRVDRAIRRTGIPAAVDKGGGVMLAAAGATVGLSLAYLLVASAEQKGTGAAALPTLVDGVVHAVGRFISLDDVFPDNGPGEGPAKFEGPPATAREVAEHEGRITQPGVPRGRRTAPRRTNRTKTHR